MNIWHRLWKFVWKNPFAFMADRDGALPVEGNDSSSHSEARSYSFDTIGQVLIQLAYNLQERRYGGGRGDPKGEEGGNEDMFPLSEQLRGSEFSLPSYTPLSPLGQIGQPRQVCHIGERRHQPGGSRTPPAIQGVRREDRTNHFLSRQSRREEMRGGREKGRRGIIAKASTDERMLGEEKAKPGTSRLMFAHLRITEDMAAITNDMSMIMSILVGTKVGIMNPSTVTRRSVDVPELSMMGNDNFILGKGSGKTRGHSSGGRHSLYLPSWRIKM